MAKLDSGRMTDATKVKQVDDQHRQFETDLEEIMGIPDNTDITNPIFGKNPQIEDGKPINADGSITGVPIFKLDAPASGAQNGVGFEFNDGTKRKRIVFESSVIKVYEADELTDPATWTQIANLEDPTGGSGLLTALSDVDLDPIDASVAGYVLKVESDGSGGYTFNLVAPATIGGVTEFTDLTDVATAALASGDEDKIVTVQDQGGGVYKLDLDDPPTGIGEPWVMWLRVNAVNNWGDATIVTNNSEDIPWHSDANDGWLNTYLWGYPISDPALISDTNLLTHYDPGGSDEKQNMYITLDAGVYRVAFWYSSNNFKLGGTREWRVKAVTGTALDSGALYTDQYEPARDLTDDGFVGVGGTQSLGVKDLIVTTGGTFAIQVRQDAGTAIVDAQFNASIIKVK